MVLFSHSNLPSGITLPHLFAVGSVARGNNVISNDLYNIEQFLLYCLKGLL